MIEKSNNEVRPPKMTYLKTFKDLTWSRNLFFSNLNQNLLVSNVNNFRDNYINKSLEKIKIG